MTKHARNLDLTPGPDTRKPVKTDAERDQMHDAVVARFPGGLSVEQFRIVTLESASDEEDGLVYPPSVVDPKNPLINHSLLISIFVDKLVEHWDDQSGRPFMHQPSRWRISDAGRAWLAARTAAGDGEQEDRKP